jgi:hypothetical protein
MDRIRVGEQQQAVAFADAFEEHFTERKTHTPGQSDGFSISGSRRIGIKPHFQAHRALESNFGFRLISGLEMLARALAAYNRVE